MEKLKHNKILYIEDLNYKNYKYYSKQVIQSVNIIIQDSNLNMSELSHLVNISRYTLRKIFSEGIIETLKYNTVNKLNKFVGEIMFSTGINPEIIEPIKEEEVN